MVLEITCKCGTAVPFIIGSEDTRAPLRETCQGCGRVWKLSIEQALPPKGF